MMAAAVTLTVLYALAMLFLLYGCAQLKECFGRDSVPKRAFSVVIPYRNEAENLPDLLASLLRLDYPAELFEILLINDASEDESKAICEDFQQKNPQLSILLLENLRKSKSPKKDAIETAISAAKNEFIITTDADCVVPNLWLREFNAKISDSGAQAIAGPVTLKTTDSKMSFLRSFQEVDNLSLQAATMGGFGVGIPFMCNAANFCYSKTAFLEVQGFEGNQHIAGGDDVFLLEKFQKQGVKTTFLKSLNATVYTNAAPTWKALIQQRLRWAAKTSAYKNKFSMGLGVLVFLMNFSLLAALAATLFDFFPKEASAFMFLIKFNVDFYLIYHSGKFFRKENLLNRYFLSSLIYPVFCSGIALLSLFSSYTWKNRRFKR